MGRGLSELQKNILQLAYTNQGSILARDILAEVYGFPATVSNIKSKEVGALIFSREAIGEKRYQSASVSVARAFNRLAARGLARREYNKGISLTKEGEDMAVMISEPTKGRPLQKDVFSEDIEDFDILPDEDVEDFDILPDEDVEDFDILPDEDVEDFDILPDEKAIFNVCRYKR